MNGLTWSKEENDWIVPGNKYNGESENWQRPIHNGQFSLHNLKEKRNKEETCTKYSGYAKFNGIPREEKAGIPINSYKDQCHEHMIRNECGISSLYQTPTIIIRRGILFYISLDFTWTT